MKQEYIDKKIGMPDVDAEWAKFEREVIGQKPTSRKPLYWGIGIAASIALVAGVFLFGHDAEDPQQLLVERTVAAHTAQQLTAPVGEGLGVGTVTSTLSQSEELQTPPPPLEGRGVAVPSVSPSATQNSAKSDLLAQTTPSTIEEAVYDCGEVMPRFPGGNRALMEFIKTNMHYPDLAMEYGAKGRVITTFKIDSLGYTANYKVIKIMKLEYDTLRLSQESAERQLQLKEQIEQQLGEESTRILSLMPRWTPGSLFGKNVSVRYNLPITFNATDAERETYLAQKQAEYDELQRQIAELTIVPTSEDLGPNFMRLGGMRVAGRDSVRIGRKTDYDFLVVVNGQALSEAEQKQMLSSDFRIYFFNRQQLVDSIYVYKDEDSKRPYVEKYGERAKAAVMVITTVTDTLCDAYVQQHPELMQSRHRVEGYVIDNDTEKSLPDTWIGYTDGAGAATDSTGHFILWLPHKDVKLQASRVGYHTVRLNQIADTTLTIRMKDATKLKEVKATPKPAIRIRGTEP